jgi:crotonobetainyl-CoA:carnitine CoA-transferase CaiB-like acyl-CoA transferase
LVQTEKDLPLRGTTVVEFSHMVMGPSIGAILCDLGAEVTKIEPVEGDHTRKLGGSGAGYFPMFNRGKRSVCLDLKSTDGLALARELSASNDIVIENFRPGAMQALGLGYGALAEQNPGLIYCSAKGFLTGPYEHRAALDEVAQMMGGLAYMTGPPGRPLRAGASVIDITGGMFGVIGILAALHERQRTGKGQLVQCSLFETTVFLVGQHMAQYAVTGQAAQPMPVRVSAWAIYDVFQAGDDTQFFLGVVSDTQWRGFCEAFELADLAADPELVSNQQRVAARPALLPRIQALFATMNGPEILARAETIGLPFAPIARPEDMFDNAHLLASGGLAEVQLTGGERTRLPTLPIEMGGRRSGGAQHVPCAGAHSREVLESLGLSASAIDALIRGGVTAQG